MTSIIGSEYNECNMGVSLDLNDIIHVVLTEQIELRSEFQSFRSAAE